MHSPPSKRAIGDPVEVDHNLQNTLDAFETSGGGSPATDISEDPGPLSSDPPGDPARSTRQESIDVFSFPLGSEPPLPKDPSRPSRAMEGIALEMCMERVALQETAMGILRDELLLTIVRECQMPLEGLPMVESYISDLELEGRLRRVGDLVVLAREGDEDLFSADIDEDEVLDILRRRHGEDAR